MGIEDIQDKLDSPAPDIPYLNKSTKGEDLGIEPIVIPVTGAARSGKDYLSRFAWKHYKNIAVLPGSHLIMEDWNVNHPDLLPIHENNKAIPEARAELIRWGKIRRDSDPDYWVNIYKKRISAYTGEGVKIVFMPGARWQTDVDFLVGSRHEIWEVRRPGQRILDEPGDKIIPDRILINDERFEESIIAALKDIQQS